MRAVGKRGASLLEVVVATTLLSVVMLAFFSALDGATRAERDALVAAYARAEAERAFQAVAGELRRASLATVAAPARGAAARGVRFRRLVGFLDDPAGGPPAPVLAGMETTYRADSTGALVREEGGASVVICRGVTRFDVSRLGTTSAFSVTVEVAREGRDADPRTGAPARYVATVSGEVFVASD